MVIKPSVKETYVELWAARPFKFQWKKNDKCGCFTTKAVFNFTRYK